MTAQDETEKKLTPLLKQVLEWAKGEGNYISNDHISGKHRLWMNNKPMKALTYKQWRTLLPYLTEIDSPWYPSIRLYKPKEVPCKP